jgi:fibronectin-binding autotransporter adhesin
VTADGSTPSVFGQDASAINLQSSSAGARLWTSGAFVLNRNMNVTLSGSGVTSIGNAGNSASESLTVNGNIVLSNPTNSSTTGFLYLEGGSTRSQAVTINGVISGNGGLRGPEAPHAFGTYVVLNGNNTFTGGSLLGTTATSIGTGVNTQAIGETWEIGSNTAFGTGAVYIHSTMLSAQPLPGVARIVAAGGPRTMFNRVVLVDGLALFDGSNPITLGGVELNGSANGISVVNVASVEAPVRINGRVSHGSLMKIGPGTLTLAGNNRYSGPTVIREGVLSVGNMSNADVGQNFSLAPSTAGYLVLSGNAVGNYGTLRYTGGGQSTNRLFTIDGVGGAIEASGTGALNFNNVGTVAMPNPLNTLTGLTINGAAGAIAINSIDTSGLVVGTTIGGNANIPAGTTITEVGATYIRLSNTSLNASALTGQSISLTPPASFTKRTLTLGGTNTGLNTLAPKLVDGSLPLAVLKSGIGTWQLTNANTYTGGTTVAGGRLLVNNTSGSGTGAGAVVVQNGGALGGTGVIGGAVTIQSGGLFSPGNNPGVLTVNNNMTFEAGSIFLVELNGTAAGNGDGDYDRLVIGGSTSTLILDTTDAGVSLSGLVGFNPA